MSAGDFPLPEILFDTLVRLPPEDLLRCLCVSKAWNATIHDQQFIKSHLQRSLETDSFRTLLIKVQDASPNDFFSLPFPGENDIIGGSGGEVHVQTVVPTQRHRYNDVLGHYNGVVCIGDSGAGEIALWNPSIQKLKKIPSSLATQPCAYSNRWYGFGYDSVNDDYKIVQTVGCLDGVVVTSNQVNVYSVKSNSWKTIQNFPYIGFRLNVLLKMVFLNGAVIWLMQNKLDYSKHIIVTLDLATEQCHEFPAPVDKENNSMLELEVLRGSLCINVSYFNNRNDVWIMKEYGVTKSWTLLFSVNRNDPWALYSCIPLFISDNGEMALLKMGLKTDVDQLFWFDIRKKSSKQVEICGLPRYFNATICSGSLCLLDGDSVLVRRQD